MGVSASDLQGFKPQLTPYLHCCILTTWTSKLPRNAHRVVLIDAALADNQVYRPPRLSRKHV